ncbi:uncharacterized protein NPIL_417401 [Nephila pilipes]|uniref:Gustatory receptor n=1 Tax=Nephila pilipes TaxID=299642 RepID=A0A8X6P3W6_NEPPI|nr:uncharacterized protein NPIL_417401 [Nephila pilipes]
MACVAVFFFYEQPKYFNPDIYIPFVTNEKSKESYKNVIILCIIATFGLSVSASGFAFFLCWNLYETMGKLIYVYGEKLKEQSQRMAWNVEIVTDYISIFKNLTFRLHEVDQAVNIYALLIYGAVISGFFNTVSVMVTGDESFKTTTTTVYIVWVFVNSVGVLIILSYYGSNITDQGNKLKRRMIEYTDKFIRFSPPISAMHMVQFLFEIIMKANLTVTGGGMFAINFGLILSIASVMVTYGVLILQLDQN